MQQLKTRALVLSRTNYGEADRILTVITPEVGKLRLMARGVRVLKSKLAGGIELFALNDISYIRGRGEIATLTSARLERNFGQILSDIERVQFGYELLKTINKMTEDQPEAAYFELVLASLNGLNDLEVALSVNKLWFTSRLLALSGHTPNLLSDNQGVALAANAQFDFDLSSMSFNARAEGKYSAEQIKFMRLGFAASSPQVLNRVIRAESLSEQLLSLINLLHEQQL